MKEVIGVIIPIRIPMVRYDGFEALLPPYCTTSREAKLRSYIGTCIYSRIAIASSDG